MIYSIFDAIYDTYSTAIFHPPGEHKAAGQLRHLDHEGTEGQSRTALGRRIRPLRRFTQAGRRRDGSG